MGAQMSTGTQYSFSPSVERRLSAMADEARQGFLDNVHRRLRTEGSPLILRREADLPLVAYLVTDAAPACESREIIKIIDLYETPVPSECTLRNIFNLSAAEARLAQRLAAGDTLEEVVHSLGIKVSTARTQLAVIFAKTGTRRQAALAAVLTRLAYLVEPTERWTQ
jgi:DNA-binding CsgD family transcriptional regulator